MYSRNDYRYYLENRLMHSDDFLAHYGVKGMKWKHHKNGLSNEIDNIKYDLRARQIGQTRKGNTVYDPVKDSYSSASNRSRRKKHPTESSGTSTYRDHLTGDYKIKRRTQKSKLFKAVGKMTGNKDTSSVEKRAAKEKAKKQKQYIRTSKGLIDKKEQKAYTDVHRDLGNGYYSVELKKTDLSPKTGKKKVTKKKK